MSEPIKPSENITQEDIEAFKQVFRRDMLGNQWVILPNLSSETEILPFDDLPQNNSLNSIFGIPVIVDDSLPKDSFEIRHPSNQGRILKVHPPKWTRIITVKNLSVRNDT